MEIAETVPFRYLIQHIGVSGEEYRRAQGEAAFTALEELRLFARQRGVEILLENIPNSLSSAERLMTFVAETHLNSNFCFDIGHAHMHEGVEAAFEIMKDRIRSTHVHDNDGKNDMHLFPLLAEGGTDRLEAAPWTAALARRTSIPLLLELKEAAGAGRSPSMPRAGSSTELENL